MKSVMSFGSNPEIVADDERRVERGYARNRLLTMLRAKLRSLSFFPK